MGTLGVDNCWWVGTPGWMIVGGLPRMDECWWVGTPGWMIVGGYPEGG